MNVREERILADRKMAESGGQVLLGACWDETLDLETSLPDSSPAPTSGGCSAPPHHWRPHPLSGARLALNIEGVPEKDEWARDLCITRPA